MAQISSISSSRLARTLAGVLAGVVLGGALIDAAFTRSVVFSHDLMAASKVRRLIESRDPGEIPIFGSSRALNGIAPSVLGPGFYNYGLGGTHADVAISLLAVELGKPKTTGAVIALDLVGLTRGLGRVGTWVPSVKEPEVRRLMGAEYRPWMFVPFVRYFGIFEGYVKERVGLEDADRSFDRGSALSPHPGPAVFAERLAWRRRNAARSSVDPALEERLVQLIRSHPGRRIVVMILPYHPVFLGTLRDGAVADALLERLRRLSNLAVIDRRSQVFPDEAFLDTVHLSLSGARTFSHDVRPELLSALAGP